MICRKSTDILWIVAILMCFSPGAGADELTVTYDPSLGTLPTEQNFVVGQRPAQASPYGCTLVNNLLQMNELSNPADNRYFAYTRHDFAFADGVTIEIDFKVISSTYEAYSMMYRGGFSFGVTDSSYRRIHVYVSDHYCWLQNRDNQKNIESFYYDFTQAFQTLTLDIDEDGGSLFLDTNYLGHIDIGAVDTRVAPNEIWFGDGTAFGKSTVQISEVNLTFDPTGADFDCNMNGIDDSIDISNGTSSDCNLNSTPDECDIASEFYSDCNSNGYPDECDVTSDLIGDCNMNNIPDDCDITESTSTDLNSNGIPDECELSASPGDLVSIGGGEYEMGCIYGTWDPYCYGDWKQHTVYVDSFEMGVFEVTNQEFCEYLNEAYSNGSIGIDNNYFICEYNDSLDGCTTLFSAAYYTPQGINSPIKWINQQFVVTPGKEDHPVVYVSWWGAASYANWLSTKLGLTPAYTPDANFEEWSCNYAANGFRLPTEAEWEYAARGGEHDPYYNYPWGNSIANHQANYYNSGDLFETEATDVESTWVGYFNGTQEITGDPEVENMINNYGLYDVAGNVYEWCNDWYMQQYYHLESPYCNPTGPDDRDTSYNIVQVRRSGGWGSDSVSYLAVWWRGSTYYNHYGYIRHDTGFRLCRRTASAPDCNINGVPDGCDIGEGTSYDCNTNGIPDECDVAEETSDDINTNGIPDECESASSTIPSRRSIKGFQFPSPFDAVNNRYVDGLKNERCEVAVV